MTLHVYDGDNFEQLFTELQHKLIEVPIVATGEWQSQDISDKPMLATHELANVSIAMGLPQSAHHLGIMTGARLPWAEDHFQERVGGEPLNPSPSEARWPFAQKKEGDTNSDQKSEGEAFSHTYPERMWPKYANMPDYWDSSGLGDLDDAEPRQGVRFAYGDLSDVINQLKNGPLTRQAFLPIWFPEDTGAVHGKRVPCTLGYHFMIRGDKLQVTYYMRSCDLIRHFQDDVYMAGRLAHHIRDVLNNEVGTFRYEVSELVMHIVSLHCFAGDMASMKMRDEKGLSWRNA